MKASLQVSKLKTTDDCLFPLQSTILMAIGMMTKKERGLAVYFIKNLVSTLENEYREFLNRCLKELDRLEVEWEIV